MGNLLKLALLLLLFPAMGEANQIKVISPKSLKRIYDAVIVSADKSPFHGKKIDKFRLFSCKNGKFLPIPFQIDEKENGTYLLPQGPHPNPGDGIYNNEDELVFMASDSGDKCKVGKGWHEIELIDPVDGGKGWVYLKFDPSMPLSDKSYVKYDPEEKLIQTDFYFLQFNKTHPIFFDKLGISKKYGGSGENIIDRMKIRFSASLIGGFISIHKNEEDFETKLIAYHLGKVRLVRLTKNWQTLFWKIPSPAADIITIFYKRSFEFPVVVDLPFDVGMFLRKTYFRVSTDMRRVAGRRLFYNSNNTEPVEINGHSGNGEKFLNISNFSWMANAGTGDYPAGWFNRVIWNAPGNPNIDINLYYMDDISHSDPPEAEKGEYGDLGYLIKGLESVKKGKIFIKSVMYGFEKFSLEDVASFINVIEKPLIVEIK